MSRLEITAPDKAQLVSKGSTKIWSEELNPVLRDYVLLT